jgi:hypothetical protein
MPTFEYELLILFPKPETSYEKKREGILMM